MSDRAIKRHVTAYTHDQTLPGTYRRHRFVRRYTEGDTELLAHTDTLHGSINGSATVAIMREEYTRGDRRYERLRTLSVGHLYRLRATDRYRTTCRVTGKTKATAIPIGERRKPVPDGMPGSLRVDTVHQGDQDGEKGVYHIHLVDEVTQWEGIASVPAISERFLEPILHEILRCFPFPILNFHSDNGGEYINKTVAAL